MRQLRRLPRLFFTKRMWPRPNFIVWGIDSKICYEIVIMIYYYVRHFRLVTCLINIVS